MKHRPLTRRHLLLSLAGAAGIGAGCNGQTRENGPQTPQDGGGALPSVSAIEVADSDLVVSLTADHDVSTLSLIGPDGQAVTEQSVATGAATVALPILSIEPDLSNYDHYTPGDHELVVETAGETNRTTVPLEPALQVTEVEQYTEGESPAQLGNLAITVENTGTGPTWVYDITYSNAPNFAANGELTGDPGIPRLLVPSSENGFIVSPGEQQKFVDSDSPLQFSDDGTVECGQLSAEFIAIIGQAVGEPLSREIKATGSDQSTGKSVSGGLVCSQFAIDHSPRTEQE